jgi:hypothetical protein
VVKPNNEASLKSMQSSIQPDGQFIHPVIRLFTATLNPFIYSNPKSASSSRRTVFFLGGFFIRMLNEAAPEPVRPVIRPCRPSVHPSGRLLSIVKE